MESTETRVAEYMAKPFARLTMRDPEGTYSARVIEFPGCFGGGDTAEEAARSLTESMEVWIESELEEGRDIPEPSWAAAYSGNIRLRLPRSMHEQAAHRADLDSVSLNQLFVAAIASYLGRADALDEVGSRLADINFDLIVGARVTVGANTEARSTAEAVYVQLDELSPGAPDYTTFDSFPAGLRAEELVNVGREEK